MANEHAVPQATQEKTQGDELEGLLETSSSLGEGHPQSASTGTEEREPAKESLK